jgi:hypothetical protein
MIGIATVPAAWQSAIGVLVPKPSRRGAGRDMGSSTVELDTEPATQRATDYLLNEAPEALEGAGGDTTTYKVACCVRDFGISKGLCLELMIEHYNERCSPPWTIDELEKKVESAYRYAQSEIGQRAPAEAVFEKANLDELPDDVKARIKQQSAKAAPDGTTKTARTDAEDDVNTMSGPPEVLALNKEYAFCMVGSSHQILRETTDAKGRPALMHYTEQSFHRYNAGKTWIPPDSKKNAKPVAVSQSWIAHPKRRTYDGLVFLPGGDVPGYYNLFAGFAIPPAAKVNPFGGKAASFLAHVRDNICRGNPKLSRWVIGWLAHMVQKPGEKPLVALVLRGPKGTGKTVLGKVMGMLLGRHYMLTASRRYLVSQFNGHMESLLLFALDEAFWSGDKQAEGILKDLITGDTHIIEHKGHAPYEVDNLTRILIIGNEDWLVPATVDERRFAVLDVGADHQKDLPYFKGIMADLKDGGYADLLRYLMDYDLTGVDLNDAPATEALKEQKEASLDPVHQWLLDSLREGKLIETGDDTWPDRAQCEQVRHAIKQYMRTRSIRTRVPPDVSIGKLLKKAIKTLKKDRVTMDGNRSPFYVFPTLEDARAQWAKFIGHDVNWDEID